MQAVSHTFATVVRACKWERLARVSIVLHLWIQLAVQTTVSPEQAQHLFLLFFPKECSVPTVYMVFTLLWVMRQFTTNRCRLYTNTVLFLLGAGVWSCGEPFPWTCFISKSQNSCLNEISHVPLLCSVCLVVAFPAFLGSLLPSLKYWCS